MFDMRSVFHRVKTLSTVVTKQVSSQIFICFLSTGKEPAYEDNVVRY